LENVKMQVKWEERSIRNLVKVSKSAAHRLRGDMEKGMNIKRVTYIKTITKLQLFLLPRLSEKTLSGAPTTGSCPS
jgi:hypothetical protein